MSSERLRVAFAVLALAGSLAACGSGSSAASHQQSSYSTVEGEAVAIHGGVLRPPNSEPQLTLTDTSGSPYNVVTQGVGKVTLEYFGYTHCPDVCPTTMADIAQALRTVPASVRDKVNVVFVTVDPYRDSLHVVRQWLNQFSTSFVGLRGTLKQTIAAQKAAHLHVSKVAKNGKTIEHAAQVITYTPDHLAHVLYFEGPSTIEDLEHDLPILTTAKGFGA